VGVAAGVGRAANRKIRGVGAGRPRLARRDVRLQADALNPNKTIRVMNKRDRRMGFSCFQDPAGLSPL
jgi:hypothetical protein